MVEVSANGSGSGNGSGRSGGQVGVGCELGGVEVGGVEGDASVSVSECKGE